MPAATLTQIKKRCFINAPWYDLKEKYLDLFLEHSIQPEIGLEGMCLYNEDHSAFKRVAASLLKHDLSCTLHAPFFDLTPGGLDRYILEKTREKLIAAFALIPIFRPRSIVCHLQFEENKHGYVYKEWFASAYATWSQLVSIAGKYNVPVMFENTYEKDPSIHAAMLQKLDSPFAGFCLDAGHLLAFAQFSRLFTFLKNADMHPIITFEPHSEGDLWQTFAYLEATKLLTDI